MVRFSCAASTVPAAAIMPATELASPVLGRTLSRALVLDAQASEAGATGAGASALGRTTRFGAQKRARSNSVVVMSSRRSSVTGPRGNISKIQREQSIINGVGIDWSGVALSLCSLSISDRYPHQH